jgi:type I restriction enzyme S subunit
MKALRCSSALDPDFLARFIKAQSSEILQWVRATTADNFPIDMLKQLRVPVPPLAEQRRIADVLDRAEVLRAKRRVALAQLDTLTQSIFLDLFGDPATNPKGWPRFTLGDLIVAGPQNGLYKPSADYGSGTPILRIDAFYDGAVTKLGTLKRVRLSDKERDLYLLRRDDIVVNRVNSMEYLGKSALIPKLDEPTVFESNMMRFEVDGQRVEPRYVVEFLQSMFVKGQILTAAKHAVNQSSINQQDVQDFRINIPPIALQRDFARRVTAVEKLKAAHRASLVELNALFAMLQHRAFRGEL